MRAMEIKKWSLILPASGCELACEKICFIEVRVISNASLQSNSSTWNSFFWPVIAKAVVTALSALYFAIPFKSAKGFKIACIGFVVKTTAMTILAYFNYLITASTVSQLKDNIAMDHSYIIFKSKFILWFHN